jgi:hypothetical protein
LDPTSAHDPRTSGEDLRETALRYFPVTLGGEVIGYLYASEGRDGAGFVRRAVNARDSLAERRWSERLRAGEADGLSPREALRRWVGAPEDREAGGIDADVAERWAPNLAALVELRKPTGTRELFPSLSGPSYRSSTDAPVSYRPITRGREVLGYLWASESDDAAGYVKRASSGVEGLRAGALWRARLAEAKGEGLTPTQALRRWVGAPGYLEFGEIAEDAEELGAPDLQALKEMAKSTPEENSERAPIRAQSTDQTWSTRPVSRANSTAEESVPAWMRRWDSELASIPGSRSRYSFLTGGPVLYRPVSRSGQVLGYLWASDSGNAADFVTRLDAGADGTYAKGWWLARLSEAYREGLRPSEALRRWVGAPVDPVGGGVAAEETVAPSLQALKEVAGRGDEEW